MPYLGALQRFESFREFLSLNSLVDNILAEVMKQTPSFFEHLVVKLLTQMGYGGSVENAGSAIGQAGDEGIDGIVREDKLMIEYNLGVSTETTYRIKRIDTDFFSDDID